MPELNGVEEEYVLQGWMVGKTSTLSSLVRQHQHSHQQLLCTILHDGESVVGTRLALATMVRGVMVCNCHPHGCPTGRPGAKEPPPGSHMGGACW